MDAYECDNHEQRDNRRKVRVVKNGDPSSMISCVLKDHISFEDLSDIIHASLNCIKTEDSQIRVFKMGGVEIFDEDVQYIKDGDILYVSFGEEFDESSNFAVYKMIRCIGEGGYGKVFEAKNRLTKEKVAIKMIDCQKIQNAKDTEMIYKELIALKNLNHKSILKVFNCFTLQKEMKVALVLEYLEGGDLKDYMAKQKILSEQESQRLFQQLFYAMSYCHKENVIHRDLKLENIMFEDKNHEKLKVVDFGISGRQSLVNLDFTEAGSIRYIAPEVLTSHAPAMPSIDIWAMGCILFWMITGNSPFPQTTRDAVQDAILKGKWSFSQDDKKKLTKSVQNLVSCMLVKNPKNRITMGDIAEHPWIQKSIEEIIQDEKITEAQEKLLERERDQALVLQAIRKKSSFSTSNNNNTFQAMNEIKNMANYYSSSQSPRRSIATPSSRGYHKSSFQNDFPAFPSPCRTYGNSQQAAYQNSPYYSTQEQNKSILPKISQQQQPRRNSFDPHIQLQSNNVQTTRNGGEQPAQNLLLINQPAIKGRILRFNGNNLQNIQKDNSPDPSNKPLYVANTSRKNSLFKHSSSQSRQKSPLISQIQRPGQISTFDSVESHSTQPDNQQCSTPQSAPSHGRSSFYEKAKLSPTKEKHRIILSGRPLLKQ